MRKARVLTVLVVAATLASFAACQKKTTEPSSPEKEAIAADIEPATPSPEEPEAALKTAETPPASEPFEKKAPPPDQSPLNPNLTNLALARIVKDLPAEEVVAILGEPNGRKRAEGAAPDDTENYTATWNHGRDGINQACIDFKDGKITALRVNDEARPLVPLRGSEPPKPPKPPAPKPTGQAMLQDMFKNMPAEPSKPAATAGVVLRPNWTPVVPKRVLKNSPKDASTTASKTQ